MKNKFNSLLARSRFMYQLGKNPTLDWLIILLLFFVLSIVFVFATISHFSPLTRSSSSEVVSQPTEVIPEAAMQRVFEYYDSRARTLEALTGETSAFVDPSE